MSSCQPLTVSINVDGGGLPGGGDDQQNVGTTWFLNNVRINEIMPGDANVDGKVDINDLTIVLAHYNQRADWSEGDFIGDGTVDINDLTIVLAHYGQTAAGAGISTVPEPEHPGGPRAGAVGRWSAPGESESDIGLPLASGEWLRQEDSGPQTDAVHAPAISRSRGDDPFYGASARRRIDQGRTGYHR